MGNMIRSRAKQTSEGEKPTSYFLNLENRHFTNKIIPKIIKSENNEEREITKQSEILEEVEKFYKSLYSVQILENVDLNLKESLEECNVTKLDDTERLQLEGFISYSEALSVLKTMSNNKSPGSDGFTAEFFKVFWRNLGHFVVRSLNYGYEIGEFSSTQKQGIITCIPKEGKSKFHLSNWRPISLLNIIYKIGSGCIANRLKQVLTKIVSSDQTGFIPGRYIGENTRLVYDLMHYTELHDIPGTLVMIDFEKAFDSVSWTFIQETLEFFNFGASFCNWINIFQNNIVSCVSQAGILSNFFKLGRGCRQVDPISPYISLMC